MNLNSLFKQAQASESNVDLSQELAMALVEETARRGKPFEESIGTMDTTYGHPLGKTREELISALNEGIKTYLENNPSNQITNLLIQEAIYLKDLSTPLANYVSKVGTAFIVSGGNLYLSYEEAEEAHKIFENLKESDKETIYTLAGNARAIMDSLEIL